MNFCLKSLAIVALGSLIAAPAFGANFVDNRNHKETNFDNGRTSPFVQRTTKAPSHARVVGRRLKCKWFESGHSPNSPQHPRRRNLVAGRDPQLVLRRLQVPRAQDHRERAISQQQDDDRPPEHATHRRQWELHLVLRHGNSQQQSGSEVPDLQRPQPQGPQPDPQHSPRPRLPHPDPHAGRRPRPHRSLDRRQQKLDVRDRVGFGSHDRTIKWGIYAADQTGHVRNETRTLYYDNCSVRVTNSNGGLGEVDPR